MREAEFKDWLAAGGANTEAGRNTRAYAVRTIENNLSTLGSPHPDLESAWRADRFDALRRRLKELKEDFEAGGTDFRILMPQSLKPANRLSSWRSWLGQYGRFLDGAPRGDRDADRIRQYVIETHIEPARERDEDLVEVLVREVNEALGLNQAWPNICQALTGKKFFEMADVAAPERIGADMSSATIFRFDLNAPSGLTVPTTKGRPFLLFDVHGGAFQPVRNGERDGRSVFHVKPLGASNRADEALKVVTIAEVARAMLVDGFSARVQSIHRGPVNYIGYGKQKLVRYELDPAIAQEIGVPPRGSVDLETLSTAGGKKDRLMMQNPTNLILYGPPGTGKTYATAEEAVRLCGEEVPGDRAALMARYDALVAERRIAFVTFHQSFTYEDFVEGLRPVVPAADGETSTAGFSLQAEPGIFRQMAERAQTARAPGSGSSIDLSDRPVYKMSLGDVADSASDFVFKEAMAEGYALLGFNDIDWSDPRFEDRENIFEAVCDRFPERDLTPNKGVVRSPDMFRNQLQIGDVLIVAKGNYKFRAIGVVEGDYEYSPRADGRYCHRRKVKWLWEDRDGRDVADIYPPRFIQSTIYRLKDAELDRPALAALIAEASQDAGTSEPLPHVLIVDEINRANISKVFGELITLLEPDKRLGMPNALTVRLPYSKRDFGVPANLHIIGTMNTADRSIALLDTALRRRFAFRELAPDAQKLPEKVGNVPLRRVLEVINDRIEYLIDREHRIGHAFFLGDGGRDRAAIDATMQGKVIPLLQEYFFEDWSRVAAVLGERPGKGGAFLACRKLSDPTESGGEKRESWSVLASFASDAYDRLIGKGPAAADTSTDEPSE